MDADDLAPYVARSPAAMVLTMLNQQVLVLGVEGFKWINCITLLLINDREA